MKRLCAGDMLDVFGTSAVMEKLDDDNMKVTVYAAMEGMRFFALQFAPVCEVLELEELREVIKRDIEELSAKYKV